MSMTEPASGVAAGLAAKLFPAAVGALIMVAVGPKVVSRREIFLRAFVALGLTYLFSDAASAYVASEFVWFDQTKHRTALDGLMGCIGWGAMGGLSALAQRFRKNPLQVIRDVKDTFTKD
jgi:hypothetical protein